jgi:T5SS/PEP-CTERM-associated repeat protein
MAAESIGAIYSTKIPGYADNADIQAAFKLYHYGSTDYNTANANTANLVSPSIAYTLNDLQTQITGLDPAGSVSKGIVDAKGDLLVGSANDTVDNLPVGSNNYVLVADSAQTLGIKWAALPGATTSVAGIVQLNDGYASTSTTLAPTANALKSVYELSERKALTINPQSGTSYTLVATDADSKMVQFTSSSSVTVTVPASTFTAGQQINLTRYGTGSVTVQGGAGVTVNSTPSLILRARYSAATLVCIDASTFVLYGDLYTD